MANPILGAIQQICQEKNIPEAEVLATIEAALAAAYRKDFGEKNQNIKVEFDPKTGQTLVFDVKEVVEDELKEKWEKEQQEREERKKAGLPEPEKEEESRRAIPSATGTLDSVSKSEIPTESAEKEEKKYSPRTMIALAEAKEGRKTAKVGDEIKTRLEVPASFGRVAAQTAKQVIVQRLREAERNVLYDEFKDKEGSLITGMVQRMEGRTVLVDLGQVTGFLPPPEQVMGEFYKQGQRLKVYIVAVNKTGKGPEIILSRSHPEIVRKLFTIEVPEIASGVVDIKSIAREAGSRSKVAVYSTDENIDPIGSAVGQRGTRVQTVIAELGGEKIDIIPYSENQEEFIKNSLLPAKVLKVAAEPKTKRAKVMVVPDQLSLAIGRQGQNVRLAARLTGWKLDIVSPEAPEDVKGTSEGAAEIQKEKEIPTSEGVGTPTASVGATEEDSQKTQKEEGETLEEGSRKTQKEEKKAAKKKEKE